jgi:hypothetical protein
MDELAHAEGNAGSIGELLPKIAGEAERSLAALARFPLGAG